MVGAAIGGVGSIISDVVSGEDVDLKKAGKNALKGATAAQTSYCITIAISGSVCEIYNCMGSVRETDLVVS